VVILAAGLTPAWQQILCFDRFTPGEVNRAERALWCGSGKVLNVGRALAAMCQGGALGEARCLAPLGGTAAAAIRDEFERDGVPLDVFVSAVPTRVCTTLLDKSGETTELVENAAALPAAELAAYAQHFAELARTADYVVLSGSLPANCPSDYYAQLMRGYKGRVLLDARGPELLATLPLQPWVVKPNRSELAKTVGRELHTDEELIAAMRSLHEQGAENVLISTGPERVWLLNAEGTWRIRPPKITNVVNPIGSGDTLAAGIAWASARGGNMISALRYAITAAAANVEELLPARWQAARIAELIPEIDVQQVA
jgi:1-phosphofructokinase family hexose kinase